MELENKDIIIKGKGIKVYVLSSIFIMIGVLIMIASFFVIKRIYNKYDEMRESYQYSSVDREAVIRFKTASDYLTENVRQYVVTGDVKFAHNYFEEKDVNKNRDISLETVSNGHVFKLECDLLNDAMKQSEELVISEIHAMKLITVANGIDAAKISDEVAAFELSDEEMQYNADEALTKAIDLLYGEAYEVKKEKINWDASNALELIEEESGAIVRENEDQLIVTLNIATALIFAMFILVVLIFIFTTLLVVRPANKFVEALDKKEKLPEIGGYEFRKFARRYNDVYRSDKKNKALLVEQGEIDELTGALKVGTLDLVRHNLSKVAEPLGIMMVDIDNFRSLKEANGYETADKIIAKVAKLFSKSFKSSDYIIRVSQDEFEMFLVRMKKSDADMLLDRIADINEKLKDSSDGLPSASVSVGVAFSESGYDVAVERQADMALNNVKENGRGSCKIAE